jgi:hypothetical protein
MCESEASAPGDENFIHVRTASVRRWNVAKVQGRDEKWRAHAARHFHLRRDYRR